MEKNLTAPMDELLKLVKKFVDDLIVATLEGSEEEILAVFDNYHHNIKFTIEKESNNAVPSIDTLVIRNDRVDE
ncbi:hypothetical protein HHI36_004908 [Cryptolaemus montrouzieri]|uniref:Uncharacterized protein n=1 Tax=Cryptolaemus montrouzieri TaxID=559131 RepID=A0ABD2NT53_9CUCU